METREELVKGLNYTKSMITKIINAQQEQVRIVAQYRKEETGISTSGLKDRSKLVVIVACIAALLFYLFLGIITGGYGTFILILFTGFMALRAWKGDKKGKKLWTFLVIVCAIIPLVSSVKYVEFWIMFIPVLLIVVFAVRYVIRMKNEQVARKNEEINRQNGIFQQQYDEVTRQLAELKKEMFDKTSSWYPKDYYSLNAVDFFLSAVENYRADSVKEMVNLFETTKEQKEMFRMQMEINNSLKQQILNQEKINTQLKYANVLNMANLFMQSGTQAAIRENTAAVNNSAYSVNDSLHSVERTINGSVDRILDKLNKWK